MATLLQLHFAFNGPFGDAMVEQLEPLAVGSTFLLMKKAPLPIWKNILPD